MNLNDNEITEEQRRFRRHVTIAVIVSAAVEAAMILAFILSYRK